MTRDDYADHLAGIASELVTRVRDDEPAANARWLATLTDPHPGRAAPGPPPNATAPEVRTRARRAWRPSGSTGASPKPTSARRR